MAQLFVIYALYVILVSLKLMSHRVRKYVFIYYVVYVVSAAGIINLSSLVSTLNGKAFYFPISRSNDFPKPQFFFGNLTISSFDWFRIAEDRFLVISVAGDGENIGVFIGRGRLATRSYVSPTQRGQYGIVYARTDETGLQTSWNGDRVVSEGLKSQRPNEVRRYQGSSFSAPAYALFWCVHRRQICLFVLFVYCLTPLQQFRQHFRINTRQEFENKSSESSPFKFPYRRHQPG